MHKNKQALGSCSNQEKLLFLHGDDSLAGKSITTKGGFAIFESDLKGNSIKTNKKDIIKYLNNWDLIINKERN